MNPPSPADQATDYLRSRVPFRPPVGIVLGSGLGGYAEQPPAQASFAYRDIPGFPACSVEGHAGRLVFRDQFGTGVALMQGRLHRYEGHSWETISRPIRILARLGVTTLILTCAAGGLGDTTPGDLLLIEDHLNLMGDNPLIGLTEGVPAGASRFLDMGEAYDRELLTLAERVGRESGLTLRRGVLAGMTGPSFETPAEAAMLHGLGAHAANMSVVPEVLVARACGLRVLVVAVITNRAGTRVPHVTAHQDVLARAEQSLPSMARLLDGLLAQLKLTP
jgi:purine-nucleoside phosphorylase